MMGVNSEREVEISQGPSSKVIWTDSMGLERTLIVPPTVYPPREDTTLLHRALSRLKGKPGRLLEIGTGTGAIGTSMAEIGWEVCGIDVNPLAVVAARGNHRNSGVFEVLENNIEDLEVHENGAWDVITWNTPYLDAPENHSSSLGPLEEAALSWEGKHPIRLLIELASKKGMLNEQGCIIALVSSGDKTNIELGKAIAEGWSIRPIETRCNGGERTTVIALWKGWEWDPIVNKSVSTTMDVLDEKDRPGRCAIAKEQFGGYGRNKDNWISKEGDITATWRISGPNPPHFGVESMHMAASLAVIGAISTWENEDYEFTTWKNSQKSKLSIKWPNDIISLTSGEKVAGILLHAESKGEEIRVSCGIGINGVDREVDGKVIKGLSNSGLDGLEIHLHRHLSSWFDQHPRVPIVDQQFLQRRWWAASSKTQIIGEKRKRGNKPCLVSKISENGLEIVTNTGIEVISGIELTE